jgi:hypothetical protein
VSEWKIARKGTVCGACEKPFEAGESFVSAIFLAGTEEGAFSRRDLHLACAETLEDEPYSRWVTSIPEKKEKKPLLDLGLAMEFLVRLVREADPERKKVALVLTLLLLRKRRVKVLAERVGDEGRVMDLLIPAKEGDLEVELPAPELKAEETEEITRELGRLFGLDDDEEEEDGNGNGNGNGR